MKSVFTLGKKKEGLKPVEKAKAEEIVDSLTKKVEANYSLEEVDKAEKEAEKYKARCNMVQDSSIVYYCRTSKHLGPGGGSSRMCSRLISGAAY